LGRSPGSSTTTTFPAKASGVKNVVANIDLQLRGQPENFTQFPFKPMCLQGILVPKSEAKLLKILNNPKLRV
jgi:hypothetical protein